MNLLMPDKEYKISDQTQPDAVAEPAVAYDAMPSSIVAGIDLPNLSALDDGDSPLPLPLEKYHTLAEFKAHFEKRLRERIGLDITL
jgi:hypothetical protein